MSDSEDESPDRRPYFEPFNKKSTHWGDPSHKPHIPNVAYILPPNLQGTPLKLALLRMQIEENAFQTTNMDEEAAYSIWRESFVDAKSWYNVIPWAVKEKAREILAREMKTIITSFDQEFPSIFIRPPPPPSYRKYHLYKPNEEQKPNEVQVPNTFIFSKTELNKDSESNELPKETLTMNESETKIKKKKNVFDEDDDDVKKIAQNSELNQKPIEENSIGDENEMKSKKKKNVFDDVDSI